MALDVAKLEALKELELMLEKLVNGPAYENLMIGVKEELKKLIKGNVDDMIIDLVVPALVPGLKAAILLQVEKISQDT
ncbi:MAG: hypothetical protein E6R04_09705 [Spirochaetes bacterium]|nr:MAG: hypothetical protein E6R04_09705 [Spirochaetota bacterium]